jgi:hypothetical protein
MTNSEILAFVEEATRRAVELTRELGIGAGACAVGEQLVSSEMAFGSVVQTFVEQTVRMRLHRDRAIQPGIAIAEVAP